MNRRDFLVRAGAIGGALALPGQRAAEKVTTAPQLVTYWEFCQRYLTPDGVSRLVLRGDRFYWLEDETGKIVGQVLDGFSHVLPLPLPIPALP